MTKEEIIDNIARLNSQTWKDREEVRTEIGKLLAELNKALEQQPSEDCVSREQAIKTISTDIQLNLEGRSGLLKYSDEIKDIIKTLLDSQKKKLKALPPVIPTQRWIPVSERLPEEDEDVQITYRYSGKRIVGKAYKMVKGWQLENGAWFPDEPVIAWQPLPKPYEEKRGNENESK